MTLAQSSAIPTRTTTGIDLRKFLETVEPAVWCDINSHQDTLEGCQSVQLQLKSLVVLAFFSAKAVVKVKAPVSS